jgi:hypothetical protein
MRIRIRVKFEVEVIGQYGQSLNLDKSIELNHASFTEIAGAMEAMGEIESALDEMRREDQHHGVIAQSDDGEDEDDV